jgi:two-component system, chemotaxis family, protein-glutamate methylesterase/glutaminase
MIRVLVAEDSVTARGLLVEMLRSDPEIGIAGEAADGLEAVAKTHELRPDVVTMDIHMPQLDGLEATRRIMAEVPTPVVIISAAVDPRDVEGSMQALRAGALTVVPKPAGPGAPDFETVRRQLVRTVKSMAKVKVVRHLSFEARISDVRPGLGLAGAGAQLVAIATSIGGPAALHAIFSRLPEDLGVPILVVQHIAPGFTAGLAAWLDSSTPLRVRVAEDAAPLEAGTVYLAPHGRHLGVDAAHRVILSAAPPTGGFPPSASFLFESAAKAYGRACVAVVLTGMGQDGTEGLRAVRDAGGLILVQDEASCVVFGMPAAAISAGLADLVLPLGRLPSQLLECVASERRRE